MWLVTSWTFGSGGPDGKDTQDALQAPCNASHTKNTLAWQLNTMPVMRDKSKLGGTAGGVENRHKPRGQHI